MGEDQISLDPTLVPPTTVRNKNPYRTIEKVALLPTPSSPGSYLLSFNIDFVYLLLVCLWSSFFDCCEQEPGFQHHLSGISLRPEGGTAFHHWGPVSGLHLQPLSPQGLAKKKKKRHCNQAPYAVALTALETHPPCSCHCQMLWAVPRHLVTVSSQDPTTRSSWCGTSWVVYVGQGASCMVCRWWGQTPAVIPDSRGGHGPPPLGIPEQKSLAAPTTSEGTIEKDIAMEHHLLLLSLP